MIICIMPEHCLTEEHAPFLQMTPSVLTSALCVEGAADLMSSFEFLIHPEGSNRMRLQMTQLLETHGLVFKRQFAAA
jgi:hypothetical protein